MKIFDIVQLNFKQLIRDKKNLFFLLLFPAVFMLIFGIGFGDNVESDIDIAIILKNEIDNKTKEQFINWSADMDIRYDRVFSIIDIKESNIQKWGDSLPFYRNVKKEGIVLWKAA